MTDTQTKTTPTITWDDFMAINMVAGTITQAEINEKAKRPAYKLWVDCGPTLGIKQSSAQITVHYNPEDLIGKKVLCVTNFEPMRIAGFKSEILVCGFYDENGDVILASADKDIHNGARLA